MSKVLAQVKVHCMSVAMQLVTSVVYAVSGRASVWESVTRLTLLRRITPRLIERTLCACVS